MKQVNWTHIKDALRGDARIFLGNEQGQMANSPKAIIIGIFVVIGLSFLITIKSGGKTQPPPPVVVSTQAPILFIGNPYDFRPLEGGNSPSVIHVTMKSGQSLGPLLQNNGVSANTAYQATEAFTEAHNPKYLRAGQDINLYFNGDEFSGLSMKPTVESTIFVNRAVGGEFNSRTITAEYKKQVVIVDSAITNSLYLDAGRLGAPDKVIVQFAQIYAHSVDFQRDIRDGDKFQMMFELYTDHKGNPVKAGDLIYTSFSPRGKTSAYYLFEKSNGREGYYDHEGKGAKRMLMRTPVNGARLSSSFGSRRHPVLGYRRQHKGVDFAAPTGTPIMAAGTGTITRSRRFGTFGNYVSIRHTDGYSTAYAHLSKYARGIKEGKRVVQGQTIGYVGATGRVTGAHLHYEVLKNGRQINPMTLSTLSGKPLKKSEFPAFNARIAQIDEMRNKAGSAVPHTQSVTAKLAGSETETSSEPVNTQ